MFLLLPKPLVSTLRSSSVPNEPPSTMANRHHTRALYDKLVEAYRENPGKHWLVAQMTGVDWRTAKRAWEAGWNGKQAKEWAMPICERFRDETEQDRFDAARRLSQNREDAKERKRLLTEAREMRIEALKQVQLEFEERETKTVQAASVDVLAAAMVVRNMVPMVNTLVKHLEVAVNANKLSVAEMTKLISMYFQATNRVAYATEAVVSLSRLLRGASTANVGPVSAPDLDLEEAQNKSQAHSLAEEALQNYGIFERYMAKQGVQLQMGPPVPPPVQPVIVTTGEAQPDDYTGDDTTFEEFK